MAEETQSTSTEQGTSTEPTLDDVYKKFNVEEAASEFQTQPHQQPQQQPQPAAQPQPALGAEIPDPVLDQAGFRSYLARQDQSVKQTLQGLTHFQQQLHIAEMNRREAADIDSAVKRVQEKIGGEVDSDFVEIALGMKARKDSKFKSIYQNRNKNPAAWNAALGAVANELKGKNQFRQDSQLTENVRAAKQSTQTTLTTKQDDSTNSLDSRLANAKSQSEYDQIWQQIRSEG